MEHVKHSTSNTVLVGNGLYIDDCSATYTQYEDHSLGMVTYWKPTAQDLEILNSNGLIRLDILGIVYPPVAVNATDKL